MISRLSRVNIIVLGRIYPSFMDVRWKWASIPACVFLLYYLFLSFIGLQLLKKQPKAWFTWDNDLIMTVFSRLEWVVCVKLLFKHSEWSLVTNAVFKIFSAYAKSLCCLHEIIMNLVWVFRKISWTFCMFAKSLCCCEVIMNLVSVFKKLLCTSYELIQRSSKEKYQRVIYFKYSTHTT